MESKTARTIITLLESLFDVLSSALVADGFEVVSLLELASVVGTSGSVGTNFHRSFSLPMFIPEFHLYLLNFLCYHHCPA